MLLALGAREGASTWKMRSGQKAFHPWSLLKTFPSRAVGGELHIYFLARSVYILESQSHRLHSDPSSRVTAKWNEIKPHSGQCVLGPLSS